MRKKHPHRAIPRLAFYFSGGETASTREDFIEIVRRAAESEATAWYLSLVGRTQLDDMESDAFVSEAVRKAVQTTLRLCNEPLREGFAKLDADSRKGSRPHRGEPSPRDARTAIIADEAAVEYARRFDTGRIRTREAVAKAVSVALRSRYPGERGFGEVTILRTIREVVPWPPVAVPATRKRRA